MLYVESLNGALHQMMEQDERVFAIGEDILDPYGGAFKVTKGLSSAFPDRVMSSPISEAALTGYATGMALRGLRPVLEIMFGDFITLCADQLINGACKFAQMYNQQVQVPLVIRTPMGGRRGYGPTHSQSLESLFLGAPGLTMVAPSHFHQPGDLLKKSVLESDSPVLFIENKLLYPQRLREADERGRIGDFWVRTISNHSEGYPSMSLSLAGDEPPQVTLIAYGGMATLAAEAAHNAFMEQEINVEVIIPSLIKPFPLADVLPSVQQSGRVVIAEESVCTAGWGAELGSLIYQSALHDLSGPIERLGAQDVAIPSARTLEDQVLPQVLDIKAAIYRQAGV